MALKAPAARACQIPFSSGVPQSKQHSEMMGCNGNSNLLGNVEACIKQTFEIQKVQLLEQLSSFEQRVIQGVSLQLSKDTLSVSGRLQQKHVQSDTILLQPATDRREPLQVVTEIADEQKSEHSKDSTDARRADSRHVAKQDFEKLEELQSNVYTEFHNALKSHIGQEKLITLEGCKKHGLFPERIKILLNRILEHFVVTKIIAGLILANAVIMALEADGSIKRAIKGWQSAQTSSSDKVVIEPAPAYFMEVDWMFAVAFTVEVVCRFVVYEWQFFFGEDTVWNVLDLVVVIVAWVEIWEGDSEDASVMPPLRLFRLMRVIRSLRVVRSLRFFAALRLVILSLMHAVKPLMWCSLMLFLILFVFANLFLQLLSMELAGPASEDDWPQNLIHYFPSFGEAMVSLLAYAFGSESWLNTFHAFYEASPLSGMLFLFYMVVIVLGVLNVVSAVFVEGALSKAKSDHDLKKMEKHSTRKEMAKKLIEAFAHIDTDGSGTLTLPEWTSFLKTKAGENFLFLFDIDHSSAQELFQHLDLDGNGGIMIDEFVMGFWQVCGAANRADARLSLQQTQNTLAKIKTLIMNSRTDMRAMFAVELRHILPHLEAIENSLQQESWM